MKNSLEPNLLIVYVLAILNIVYLYLYFKRKTLPIFFLLVPIIVTLLLNKIPSSVFLYYLFLLVLCVQVYIKNTEEISKHLIYPTGVAIAAGVLLYWRSLSYLQKRI